MFEGQGAPFTESEIKTFTTGNLSLTICKAMTNTDKHRVIGSKSAMTADISAIGIDGDGQTTVTIEYSDQNQSGKIDGLQLATECMDEWRKLLATKGIPEPT